MRSQNDIMARAAWNVPDMDVCCVNMTWGEYFYVFLFLFLFSYFPDA